MTIERVRTAMATDGRIRTRGGRVFRVFVRRYAGGLLLASTGRAGYVERPYANAGAVARAISRRGH